MTPPVLFLIFNRPEITQRTFAEIRKAQPRQLFVAADGPRPNKKGEAERCKATRQAVMDHIDWDCQVHTLFREHNLGCRKAVWGAINWFFEHVEAGVILEDDCLPHPDFFHFCDQMLSKYAHNEKIGHISGASWLNEEDLSDYPYDYFFIYHTAIWGWATWRHKWQKYELDIVNTHNQFQIEKLYERFKKGELYLEPVLNKFQALTKGKVDTWDYQWHIICCLQDWLAVTPTKNLVSNIGWGKDATHTDDPASERANRQTYPLNVQKHPKKIRFNKDLAIKNYYKNVKPKQANTNHSSLMKDKIKDITKAFKTSIPIRGENSKAQQKLSLFIKTKVHSPSQKIFISCMPKTASTYLSNALCTILNYNHSYYSESYSASEQDLSERFFIDRYEKNDVIQQHLRASEYVIQLFRKYQIRPLILTRNIYDILVSLKDHCLNETINWPMFFVPRNFQFLSEKEQINVIVKGFTPWLINYYVGWFYYIKELHSINAKFIDYQNFKHDPDTVIKEIVDFYSLEIDQNKISEGLDYVDSNKSKYRYNVGKQNRGQYVLDDEHKAFVKSYTELFPSVDFSNILPKNS